MKKIDKEYQRLLKLAGYDVGVIDGIQGPNTTAAIEQFQRDHGLDDDGIFGPKTLAKIVEVTGAKPLPPKRGNSLIRVCPGPNVVHGVDVSGWQKQVDWAQVAASGVKFATIKASEGLSYRDTMFKKHWNSAKREGILRNAYHFFHPRMDPVKQAELFLSVLGSDRGELWPVIDIEWTDGMSKLDAAGADAALKFLERLEKDACLPEIYTAIGFFHGVPGPERFGKYKIWLAQYGVTCPSVPPPWTEWNFWQYTDHEPVPGAGKIDASLFNGTLDQLRAVCIK